MCESQPGIGNCGMAVWDGISILLPYVPGSWILRIGTKVITKAEDVSKVARLAGYGAKATIKVANSIDDVKKGVGLTFGSYYKLSKLFNNKVSQVEIHHIVEKRFAALLGKSENEMMSVALEKGFHQNVVTQRWKNAISYGQEYIIFTKNQLIAAAEKVYFDMPILNAKAIEEIRSSRSPWLR